MKNKNTIASLIVWLFIGIVLVLIDLFLIKNNLSFLDNSVKTNGEIVDMIREVSSEGGTSYRPKVSFVDNNGETITFASNVSSGFFNYRKGDNVPVLYNKNDSGDAKINKFIQLWGAEMILSFMAIVMLFFSLMAISKRISEIKLRKYLLLNGNKISAKVTSIQDSLSAVTKTKSKFSYTNLNKKTYQIIAQWLNPGDGKMYVFESDFLDYNPESIILDKEIGVYIDQSNPLRYYVDLSTLPKIAN